MSSIKSLLPKFGKASRTKQGYFNVSNSKKYVNPDGKPCIYRSSYEYRFMFWCEHNDYVKHWSSEPTAIKYTCLETGKTRNYWVDFCITTINDELWVIEVKPAYEVNAAKAFGKKFNLLKTEQEKRRLVLSNKTAAKNWSKWQHAKAECEKRGYEFKIVTENFLNKH
jgi:hypothetical protein